MKKFWFLSLLLLGLAACGEENTEPVTPEGPKPPVEEQQVVTATLTAPTEGTEVELSAGSLTITGDATVNVGEIESVVLKVGQVEIEQVSEVPFSYTYTLPAESEAGELTISLTVTGDREASDTDEVTILLVQEDEGGNEEVPAQEITATLTAPTEGYAWVSDQPLTISGEAEINRGSFQTITLTIGETVISEVKALPFTYSYTAPESLAEGSLTILLEVVGDDGGRATDQVTITHTRPTAPTPPPTPDPGEMVDLRDNKIYKTVTLGTQVWMAENLAYLPEVYPSAEAANSGTAQRMYVLNYEGSDVAAAKATEEYQKLGVLYNWYAANNCTDDKGADATAVPSGVQGICPEGWHLPSKAEWQVMEAWVAEQLEPVTGNHWTDDWGDEHYDSDLKNVWSALAGVDVGWGASESTDSHPDLANGPRDTFGFCVKPAGKCWHTGSFGESDADTGFWATDMQTYGGGCVELRNMQYEIAYTKSGYSARRGYSVRCVKD